MATTIKDISDSSIYSFGKALEGIARPNQFRIHINFPSFVTNGAAVTSRATYLARSGNLPGYTNNDLQIYYRGRQYHEVGDPTYEQWSCEFYNTRDFQIRAALEQWSNNMNVPEAAVGLNLPREYKSDIQIEQLDRIGTTLKVYTLIGAWPSQIGQIELNFGEAGEGESFQCTFVYDYFIVGDATSLGVRAGNIQ